LPDKELIEDSLKKIFEGIRQLKQAFPKKDFTIDGRLVGDIGEAIVERDYDVELYRTLVEDYDGVTSNGRRVQIKATFKDHLTFKKVSDYYLGIKIFEDGSYEEVFNGPGYHIQKHYAHRKGVGETLLSFPNKTLKALSRQVRDSDKIKKRLGNIN